MAKREAQRRTRAPYKVTGTRASYESALASAHAAVWRAREEASCQAMFKCEELLFIVQQELHDLLLASLRTSPSYTRRRRAQLSLYELLPSVSVGDDAESPA